MAANCFGFAFITAGLRATAGLEALVLVRVRVQAMLMDGVLTGILVLLFSVQSIC